MLKVGAHVAGYRIDGVLGQGGMGIVYEATQLTLDRQVALKLVVPEIGEDAVHRERFRLEGLRQAALDHPHIVTVYEAGESAEGLFFAMRLVRGPNLKDMILSRELDAGRTMRILGPIGGALDTAHQKGLIHRDIKPQNILIGGRDHAYLADFGLTKALGERSLTKSGAFVGTLDYVSPEQIKGEQASPASDVYSLTAVLYECLTGVVAFPKDSEAAVLYAHLSLNPPRLTEQRPDLPGALDRVIARGMAKRPEDRYATAGDLVDATERAFNRMLRAAMRPPGPIESPEETGIRKAEARVSTAESVLPGTERARDDTARTTTMDAPARRRRWPVGAGAAVAVAVAGAAFVVGSSGGDDSSGQTFRTASLALEGAPGWVRASNPPEVPGLELDAPLALRQSGEAGLVAGRSEGAGPTLLPASLTDRLPSPPVADDPVRLGNVDAYRYEGLRVKGIRRPVTIYAAPTTEGVATVVCVPPAGASPGFASDCAEVAATMRVTAGRPLALGPREEYATAVNAALGGLDEAQGRDQRRLDSATTPDGQAAAAADLSADYARVRSALRRAPAGPAEAPAQSSLLAAARSLEASYDRAARAARAGHTESYSAAATAVRRGRAGLERALARLQAVGYRIG